MNKWRMTDQCSFQVSEWESSTRLIKEGIFILIDWVGITTGWRRAASGWTRLPRRSKARSIWSWKRSHHASEVAWSGERGPSQLVGFPAVWLHWTGLRFNPRKLCRRWWSASWNHVTLDSFGSAYATRCQSAVHRSQWSSIPSATQRWDDSVKGEGSCRWRSTRAHRAKTQRDRYRLWGELHPLWPSKWSHRISQRVRQIWKI